MPVDALDVIPLAVLDPALGRTGAHNRGFAEMMAARASGPLCFWCSTDISDAYRQALAVRGVNAVPVFNLDFYRLVHEPGGIAEHWDWIYRLALDYQGALRQVVERWPGQPVRVLHHTLSWEHASALSIAIQLLGDAGTQLDHLALLMYSPGVTADGRLLDSSRRLNFRLAFSALARMPNVSLYAACSEYAAAYARLLDKAEPLQVHPCFLGDWRQRPARAERSTGLVLAYVGEIKQEKGFIDLPERLAAMLRDSECRDQRFVVQVTEARTPTAREILGKLHAMAVVDPRIDLHDGYWRDEQLHEWLSMASALCLDYDARAYSHKTSGLLWLAAWHGLPVRVPAGSWLDREARRLGTPRIPSDRPPLPRFARRDKGAVTPGYFETIFAPFDEWVRARPLAVPTLRPASQLGVVEAGGQVEADIREARGQAARRMARPLMENEGGIDVVLFWKQNDSTLYGRRSDMVARYLASRRDVRRVMVVDAPISEARLAELASGDSIDQQRWIYERTLEKLRGSYDIDGVMHRVLVYPSVLFAPDSHEWATPDFVEAYAEFLANEFELEGIDPGRSVFWIYPRDYSMPALLQRFAPAYTVVDVVDDHRTWPGVSVADKQRLGDNYRDLLAGADLALANCEAVRSSMKQFHEDIQLVPNGCDEARPPSHGVEAHEGLAEIEAHVGKVIGFVGNLEAKIDIGLLESVARRFPEHLLVLVGSTHANPRVRTLLRHPNVRLPGVVPYDQLGAWLSRFDVGLIPHLDMELTRHMNPLKAHVYLSWGVPVVSTAVANVDADGELVRMAVSHGAFLHQVETTLAAPPPNPGRFRDHVAANGWRARLEHHVDMLGFDQVR